MVQKHRTFCLTMRCFEENIAPDVFGEVLEKVKHLTNDASNDVSRPALVWGRSMQTKVWRSNCSSHLRTLMVSSGVVDSIQSIDLVQMIEGWRQFVKIWRKIHRFIGPGFSGFPLRWFCEVAKIWGTDSANPLDVDDHKDLGTDQFRFPLTGCSTYFCWREKRDRETGAE